MDDAIERAVDFVGPKGDIRKVGSGYQFESIPAADGSRRVARFDVDPNTPHVQKQGAHLNMETHTPDGQGGHKVRGAEDNHTPIDPDSVRPGDY